MHLTGTVESGVGDAARWLAMFNAAYAKKVGWPVFPGSLNLRLPAPLDWGAPEVRERIVEFPRQEYGGERDILLLPCVLRSCGDQPGCLWRTTRTDPDPESRRVIEIIAPVGLREAFGLTDGDFVEIEIP